MTKRQLGAYFWFTVLLPIRALAFVVCAIAVIVFSGGKQHMTWKEYKEELKSYLD